MRQKDNSTTYRVVDWGGLYGYHFLVFRKLFPLADCKWTVVERPLVVRVAKEKYETVIGLEFSETIPEDDTDLLVMSGVLQSVSDPYLSLTKLVSNTTNAVFIDRLPLTNLANDFVSINLVDGMFYEDGIGRKMPHWFFSRENFLDKISTRFDIIWETPDPYDGVRTNRDNLVTSFCSLLLRPRDKPSVQRT